MIPVSSSCPSVEEAFPGVHVIGRDNTDPVLSSVPTAFRPRAHVTPKLAPGGRGVTAWASDDGVPRPPVPLLLAACVPAVG